jgi:phage-related protein
MPCTLEYFNARVQAEVDGWPAGIRAAYRHLTLRIAEHGPNLGLPHTRAMGDGLFEIRAQGPEGIGRAFFCTLLGSRVVILHGFVKKTQATPAKELNLARARLREVKHAQR